MFPVSEFVLKRVIPGMSYFYYACLFRRRSKLVFAGHEHDVDMVSTWCTYKDRGVQGCIVDKGA